MTPLVELTEDKRTEVLVFFWNKISAREAYLFEHRPSPRSLKVRIRLVLLRLLKNYVSPFIDGGVVIDQRTLKVANGAIKNETEATRYEAIQAGVR